MAGHKKAKFAKVERALLERREGHNPCVFISHKKEDEAAAESIGQYLMNAVDVDIYLDKYDATLRRAVSSDNEKQIVESIKEGLKSSTALPCIISDKTRWSWWVPYEVGIADISGYDIASIKTKAIDDLPEFLKIRRTIYDTRELKAFAEELNPLRPILESYQYNRDSIEYMDRLKLYFD